MQKRVLDVFLKKNAQLKDCFELPDKTLLLGWEMSEVDLQNCETPQSIPIPKCKPDAQSKVNDMVALAMSPDGKATIMFERYRS
eukprot:8921944-Karenia_brevis.AAC.1